MFTRDYRVNSAAYDRLPGFLMRLGAQHPSCSVQLLTDRRPPHEQTLRVLIGPDTGFEGDEDDPFLACLDGLAAQHRLARISP